METSGLQGSTQKTPRRHPGDTKEAPRRHPGGSQEAPRGTQGTRESPGGLGSKKINTSKLKCKKKKNMTISRGVFEGRCHQVPRLATKSIRHPPRGKQGTTKGSLPKPPEPLQMKSVSGIMTLKPIWTTIPLVVVSISIRVTLE